MSPLEILQLVGYGVAAALPLWLGALLWRRRHVLSRIERVLLPLAFAMGAWHASNLSLALHQMLGLSVGRWSFALRAADTVAVVSVTLIYSLLLHLHLHLWASARGRDLTPTERARVYLSYAPALFLVAAAPPLWVGPYRPMFEELKYLVWPFALWATYVLSLTAITDWLIARRTASASERRLMRALSISFMGVAALVLAAHAFGLGRGTEAGQYLHAVANLGSLLPTALLAYHIYRYRYLELIVRESLIAGTFAGVVLVIYLYGIRTLSVWLTERFGLRQAVVETLLILSLALVAAPLRRWLELKFRRLFEQEAALYRDVVSRVGARAGERRELAEYLRYAEERITEGLSLRRVRLLARLAAPAGSVAGAAVVWEEARAEIGGEPRAVADEPTQGQVNGIEESVGLVSDKESGTRRTVISGIEPLEGEWAEKVLAHLRAQLWEPLEGTPLLRERGYELALALRREERVAGLMLVEAKPDALTHDARAVLEILAGQIAVGVEDCRLVEENSRLERRLAQRERLAALGRMATTVAHEVKNPLSAIKTIAQVMREDGRVAVEYARDLDLIVGEADRLGRSVTQLLDFARPSAVREASGPPLSVSELTGTAAALFRTEAEMRGVIIELNDESCNGQQDVDSGNKLDGATTSAARDALNNLLLNAIQATPRGGRVRVTASCGGGELKLTVEDEGPGVPLDMRERIWQPFFTTKQRGTGLGLAIVRKRVEDVGGEVRLAESQASGGRGTGARFEMRLPLALEDVTAAAGRGHAVVGID